MKNEDKIDALKEFIDFLKDVFVEAAEKVIECLSSVISIVKQIHVQNEQRRILRGYSNGRALLEKIDSGAANGFGRHQ